MQGSWGGKYLNGQLNTREGSPIETHAAVRDTVIVMHPSMMKSHLHPAMPLLPSRPENIAAAKRPENAVARTRPEYKTAVRNASSLRVYQHESK